MSKPTGPRPPLVSAHKTGNQPATQQTRVKPVAPPVYRPHPTPKVLQPKAAAPQVRKAPAAPPVYRPQPSLKCLQPRAATPQQSTPGRAKAVPEPPSATRVLQPKAAAPPVYRPQPTSTVLQRKASPTQSPHAGTSRSAPAAPPAISPRQTLQESKAYREGSAGHRANATHRPPVRGLQAKKRCGVTDKPAGLSTAGGVIQRVQWDWMLTSDPEEAERLRQTQLAQRARATATPSVRVGAGRYAGAYENDMLRGGPSTVKVNLNKLWELWQAVQRDTNIHRPAVEEYKEIIRRGGHIDAPFFDSIDLSEVSGVEIRTSEGRHRLHAAKEGGLATIYVLRPSDMAMELVEIMDLKAALFPGL
jgi:hypothetical protein